MDSHLGTFVKPVAVIPFDDTNLKAYWKFDEASGDIINQSESDVDLGAGADMQVTGATYGATGIIDEALSFDGVNDYGEVGTSVSQWNYIHEANGLSTICAWIKLTTLATDTEYIFKTNNNNSAGRGFVFHITGAEGLNMQITTATATCFEGVTTANYVPDTTNWHFYVVRTDLSTATDTWIWHRDNGNEEKGDRTNIGTAGDATNKMICCIRNDLSTRAFAGDLDETSFWNKIMSSDDETSLYNGGAGLAIY